MSEGSGPSPSSSIPAPATGSTPPPSTDRQTRRRAGSNARLPSRFRESPDPALPAPTIATAATAATTSSGSACGSGPSATIAAGASDAAEKTPSLSATAAVHRRSASTTSSPAVVGQGLDVASLPPPAPSPPPAPATSALSSSSTRPQLIDTPVACLWPPAESKATFSEDDVRDKNLMAVCAALASLDNLALGLQELADICLERRWLHPGDGKKTPSELVFSAIRSHYRRAANHPRPSILHKHVLVGSSAETALAAALHPQAFDNARRPRGTVWYLSHDAGYPNPFERANLGHLLAGKDKDGATTTVPAAALAAAVAAASSNPDASSSSAAAAAAAAAAIAASKSAGSKRKREEAAAWGAGSGNGLPKHAAAGNGLKIRLKMAGLREEDESPPPPGVAGLSSSGFHDPLAMSDQTLMFSSLPSENMMDMALAGEGNQGGRRQRGPKHGFPNAFVREAEGEDEENTSDDEDEQQQNGEEEDDDDRTPSSSLPNHHFLPVAFQPRASFPNRPRHSLPSGLPSRSPRATLHAVIGGRQSLYNPQDMDDDSSSSSGSSNGEDFHQSMLTDEFAFNMDLDGDGGDTPATTPRDGGADSMTDQQQASFEAPGAASLKASPPPRRTPYPPGPPPPTPAEIIAACPSRSSALYHLHQHYPAALPQHPSPISPQNHNFANNRHHQHYPPPTPITRLGLPRMPASSVSPSPSPARPTILLPHPPLPTFNISSPSRGLFFARLNGIAPPIGSAGGGTHSQPGSPSVADPSSSEDAFDLPPHPHHPHHHHSHHSHHLPSSRHGSSHHPHSSDPEDEDDESICAIGPDSPTSEEASPFFHPSAEQTPPPLEGEDVAARLAAASRWARETTTGVRVAGDRTTVRDAPPLASSPPNAMSGGGGGVVGGSVSSEEEDDDVESAAVGRTLGVKEEDGEGTAVPTNAAVEGGFSLEEVTRSMMLEDEDDDDEASLEQEAFLGPESVGLDELERVWGTNGFSHRRSFAAAVMFDRLGSPVVKREFVDNDDAMNGALGRGQSGEEEDEKSVSDKDNEEEVRKAKAAFAMTLVEQARAASAVVLADEGGDDDEGAFGEVEEGDCRSSPELELLDRRKKHRRTSSLPKPLPAPLGLDLLSSAVTSGPTSEATTPALGTTTASMTEMVDRMQVDHDPMDLLCRSDAFSSGAAAPSSTTQPPSKTPTVVPVTVPAPTPSNSAHNPFRPPTPAHLTAPAVPPVLHKPLAPIFPDVTATLISGIPVFYCKYQSIVLLRRIDTDWCNASTTLAALGIVSHSSEADKVLSTLQDRVVVSWGEHAGPGINGTWVPLGVARAIALRFTAGSPLLGSFFDPALAGQFGQPIAEARARIAGASATNLSGFEREPKAPVITTTTTATATSTTVSAATTPRSTSPPKPRLPALLAGGPESPLSGSDPLSSAPPSSSSPSSTSSTSSSLSPVALPSASPPPKPKAIPASNTIRPRAIAPAPSKKTHPIATAARGKTKSKSPPPSSTTKATRSAATMTKRSPSKEPSSTATGGGGSARRTTRASAAARAD